MLKRRIIPCLDVNNGRVVKGVNFVSLRDAGDPVEQAIAYNAQGADEICFLDIGASPEGRAITLDVVKRTALELFVPLIVGGGVRSVSDVSQLLHAGADKVAINTAAIRTPEVVTDAARDFGSQAIVVAVDSRRRPDGVYEVYSHGGRTPEGKDAIAWCRELEQRGAGEILLTSMDRDGTRNGYEIELTSRVSSSIHIPVIASGGVGTLEHLAAGFLEGGADAALAASIFHYGEYSIRQAKDFLLARGVPVRPV